MKILLAEDEQDLREVIEAFLTMEGYVVDTAENGREAVDRAAESAYDAIVMDIMMPVMDGIAAMQEIRGAGDTTPAIFLTAKSQVEDRIEGLDAGADDYLTKPFAMKELSARVRALTRRKRDYRPRSRVFSDLELDADRAELKSHNSIGLAAREVRMMELLMANTDREISTEEFLKEVWAGEDTKKDVVWMYISFLRRKLQSVGAAAEIAGEKNGSFRLVQR